VFADAMMRASEFLVRARRRADHRGAPLIPLGRVPARTGAGWPI
jgi:hypothetical protein